MATDADWMRLALDEARLAGEAGEVPVGAVLVKGGTLVATGRNASVASHDPGGHAEMNALRAGGAALGNYRLQDCDLFVTLEPCAMCAGAMLHARLSRVVFGARDPKTGAAGSVLDLFAQTRLNHRTKVQGGVLEAPCAEILQRFFHHRREAAREYAEPLRDDALRTPPERFAALADMPFAPHYVNELAGQHGWRMHFADEGPRDSAVACVCVHGPGEWSYYFRNLLAAPPVRVLAPDLIGFGKSDKPKREGVHRLEWHRDMLLRWLDHVHPGNAVLVHSAAASRLAAMLVAAAPTPFAWIGQAPDSGEPATAAWQAPFPRPWP